MKHRTIIVIPTYCEILTLPSLVERIRGATPDVDILVVDDSSPDGTGEWADSFAAGHPWLTVLHREAKSGLASAYTDGFRRCISLGYQVLVQMDADGSHRPEQLPRLLARLNAPDQPAGVIGSRWIPGGEVAQWTWQRKLLSIGGNLYVRAALGMGVHDATAGFRAYRAQELEEAGVLDSLKTRGYGYQVEMTYRLFRAGFSMVEVPTDFDDRVAGESKMSANIAIEQLCQISRWALLRMLGRGPR